MKAMMTLQLGDGTFKYDHRMIDALSNALPLVFSRLDFSCVARVRQLEAWLPKRALAVQGNHTLHTDINSEYPWSPIGGGGAVMTPAVYFRRKRVVEPYVRAIERLLADLAQVEPILRPSRRR
jgi:hypothetical protein